MEEKKETFSHLITFGGHPVKTAAALNNLNLMKEKEMVTNAKEMGAYLYEKLNQLKDLKHCW